MKKLYSIALAALVTLTGFAQTKNVQVLNSVAKALKAEVSLTTAKMKKSMLKTPKKGAPAVNPVYDTYTWTDAGESTYLDNLITSLYNLSGLDAAMACTVQEAQGHPGIYRLVNPWGSSHPANLIVDASNPDMVVLPYQSIPVVDSSDGQTYIASYSWIATSDDEDFGFGYSAEDFIEFFPELNITLDEENKFIYIPANSFAYYWPEAEGDYAGAFYDGNAKEGYIILPGGTYVSPWIDLGMGEFSESILCPSFGDTSITRTNEEVQVLQSRFNPAEFQIINPWKGLYQKLGFTAVSPTITLDCSTPANVLLPQTSTGINGGTTAGIYYVMSQSYYNSIVSGSASSTPTAYRITYTESEETIDGKKYSVKTFTFPYRSVYLYAGTSGSIYYTGSASDTDASTIVVKTEIIPDYTFNFTVLNAAGNPTEGATVTMTPQGGEAVTLTTDADGKASTSLKGYYDGTVIDYTVSNVAGMLDYSGSFTVADLTSDIEVKMIENPNKEYTFNFTVTDDEGRVVPNIAITVSPVISSAFTLTTNAQGKATTTITGPYENSTVQYAISATDYYEATSGQFTVTQLVTNANIVLQVKHHDVAIAFTVVNNNNEPLAGASITVSDADNQIVATVTTDENGYAKTSAFADANGKVYSYVVTANKHTEAAGEITLLGYDTTVSPYTYHCQIALTRLTDTFIIEFNVSNDEGEAVSDASVTLKEGDMLYGNYTTDENGYCASAPLIKMDGKTLNYTIEAAGYNKYENTVTVADYDDFDLPYYIVSDIVLTKTNGIAGIEADGNENVRYFNLQGVEIANPAKGQIVIRVEGNNTSKIVK